MFFVENEALPDAELNRVIKARKVQIKYLERKARRMTIQGHGAEADPIYKMIESLDRLNAERRGRHSKKPACIAEGAW